MGRNAGTPPPVPPVTLSAEALARIDVLVAAWPPMTDRQAERISALLWGTALPP